MSWENVKTREGACLRGDQHSISTPHADSNKYVSGGSRINQCTPIRDVVGAQRGPSPTCDEGGEGTGHVRGGFLEEVAWTPPP